MASFLFFLLNSSSLLFATVKCSGLVDNAEAVNNQNGKYFETGTSYKLSPITSPSYPDLGSLSIQDSDPKFNRKRRIVNNSTVSPIGNSYFSRSRSSRSSSININEYSQPSQIFSAEDDYFFFDLDNYDYKLNTEIPKSVKKKTAVIKVAPKLIEDFVVSGSEIVPKAKKTPNIKQEMRVSDKDSISESRAHSGLYDSIKTNILIAISSFSPKSVHKCFEAKSETSDKTAEKEDKNVLVNDYKPKTVKKDSSDDFSDMIIRHYQAAFRDLEAHNEERTETAHQKQEEHKETDLQGNQENDEEENFYGFDPEFFFNFI